MQRASDTVHPDRRPRRWAVTAVMGGVFAIAVLVAAVRPAQTGSLFERLFTPKEAQCAEASTSPENAALASVRLTVEGMVCYG